MLYYINPYDLGSLTLNLWNMPHGAKSSWMGSLSKMPRINLFKVKKTNGWWPFISTDNNKNTIVVSVLTIRDYNSISLVNNLKTNSVNYYIVTRVK